MDSSIREGIFDILAYHKVVQFVSKMISLVKYRIIVQNAHAQNENKSEDSKDSSYGKSNRYSITSLTHHHHHHHISAMELGHLLTLSGLTYPELSSKVCHDFFCQLGISVSLSWVIYYEAFYLHVVSSFSCIPVICPKLVLLLIPLQFVYLFCNLCKCILLFFSCISSLLPLFFWRPLL